MSYSLHKHYWYRRSYLWINANWVNKIWALILVFKFSISSSDRCILFGSIRSFYGLFLSFFLFLFFLSFSQFFTICVKFILIFMELKRKTKKKEKNKQTSKHTNNNQTKKSEALKLCMACRQMVKEPTSHSLSTAKDDCTTIFSRYI